MVAAVLIVILAFLFVVYAIITQGRPANFPPGPKWWPFIGNGPMLRKMAMNLNGQHRALSKLAEEYDTPLLGLRLGGEYVVVGFTPSVVKDILTRDEFCGRPDSFFMRLRCFGKREGITGCDGPMWHQQRAFLMRHMKIFGLGKTTMEDLITEEIKDLIEYFKNERKPVNLSQILAPTVMSVIWGLVAGKRLNRTDGRLAKLLELLNTRSRAFDMAGGYLNQFPWLRFFAPEKTGFNLLKMLNAELKLFLQDIIEEHKESYKPDVTRDMIDAFLHEYYNSKNDRNSQFTDSQLIMVLLDLFIAGSQTTSNTLDFAFLHMIKYPEVQEKVYQCLLNNIGTDVLPKMVDRSRLSYVEAVLAEIQRLCNVVPVCGPRRCLTETELCGYRIPKNSTLLISLWSVHKDQSIFPDAELFKPERFMNEDGRFVHDNNLIPFGLGKRRCLGDILAKACILLIFSSLMQHFRVVKPERDPEPSLEPLHGITLAPQKYMAEFIPR